MTVARKEGSTRYERMRREIIEEGMRTNKIIGKTCVVVKGRRRQSKEEEEG